MRVFRNISEVFYVDFSDISPISGCEHGRRHTPQCDNIADHSRTHFRDLGESEDSSEKTEIFEGDVLQTIEDITYIIFERFAIL